MEKEASPPSNPSTALTLSSPSPSPVSIRAPHSPPSVKTDDAEKKQQFIANFSALYRSILPTDSPPMKSATMHRPVPLQLQGSSGSSIGVQESTSGDSSNAFSDADLELEEAEALFALEYEQLCDRYPCRAQIQDLNNEIDALRGENVCLKTELFKQLNLSSKRSLLDNFRRLNLIDSGTDFSGDELSTYSPTSGVEQSRFERHEPEWVWLPKSISVKTTSYFKSAANNITSSRMASPLRASKELEAAKVHMMMHLLIRSESNGIHCPIPQYPLVPVLPYTVASPLKMKFIPRPPAARKKSRVSKQDNNRETIGETGDNVTGDDVPPPANRVEAKVEEKSAEGRKKVSLEYKKGESETSYLVDITDFSGYPKLLEELARLYKVHTGIDTDIEEITFFCTLGCPWPKCLATYQDENGVSSYKDKDGKHTLLSSLPWEEFKAKLSTIVIVEEAVKVYRIYHDGGKREVASVYLNSYNSKRELMRDLNTRLEDGDIEELICVSVTVDGESVESLDPWFLCVLSTKYVELACGHGFVPEDDEPKEDEESGEE